MLDGGNFLQKKYSFEKIVDNSNFSSFKRFPFSNFYGIMGLLKYPFSFFYKKGRGENDRSSKNV